MQFFLCCDIISKKAETFDAMPNFTRNAIIASFLKLLEERPLNKITIKDIVEDCGINRNSFYYHFQDIPALLGEIVSGEIDRIINQ